MFGFSRNFRLAFSFHQLTFNYCLVKGFRDAAPSASKPEYTKSRDSNSIRATWRRWKARRRLFHLAIAPRPNSPLDMIQVQPRSQSGDTKRGCFGLSILILSYRRGNCESPLCRTICFGAKRYVMCQASIYKSTISYLLSRTFFQPFSKNSISLVN